MDILYQLPFPKEVCSKIFMYACKSPHTGLGVAIFKKIIRLPIYNKLIKNGGIVLDGDENLVKFRVWDKHSHELLGYYERKHMTFDIVHLASLPKLTDIVLNQNTGVMGDIKNLKSLRNLIVINLWNTGVTGDIENLTSLTNLTEIYLSRTGISGNIAHLNSLLNLTEINLSNTGVTGNIAHLESLPKLTEIRLSNTGVTGNIAHLESLRELTGLWVRNTGVTGDIVHLQSQLNLTWIILDNTGVTVDEEAFNEYRKSTGLPECYFGI